MTTVPASDSNIARAAWALRDGRTVAFPTETVYGLGADAANGEAVASVFEIKGRPRFNPLIVHVTGLEAAQTLAEFSMHALELVRAFWPGALTLVLPKLPGCPVADLTTVGLDTVALRAPSHAVAQALLEASGLPIAAPSANRAGHVSPTSAVHVAADLGDGPALILDGGPAALGIESTVVDATSPDIRLLRPGAIPRADIETVLGQKLEEGPTGARPSSPGQLASHYAPRARLRLNASDARTGEALLAFGPDMPSCSGATVNLSPAGDLREAAANLFSALRRLDASDSGTIAVMPVPEHGLGEAINDRLVRAAAPRGG